MNYCIPTSLNPKKRLKKAVRCVKELNRAIAADTLWHGRFYARIIAFSRLFFTDGSGMTFMFKVEFVDMKTNTKKIEYLDEYDLHTVRLFMHMNDFIVLFVNAWQDDPRNDKTIYRSK